MPGKVYIVLTRDQAYTPTFTNAIVVHSVPEAIKVAEQEHSDETPVMGGNSIYREMLPYTDRIYLTKVHAAIAGDTHFPELNPNEWQEVSREPHTKDEKNEYDFDFVILDRK